MKSKQSKVIKKNIFQHALKWAVCHWSWWERVWRSCGHYREHLYSYLSQRCSSSCSLPLLHLCSTVWICWVSKSALKNMLNSKLLILESSLIYQLEDLQMYSIHVVLPDNFTGSIYSSVYQTEKNVTQWVYKSNFGIYDVLHTFFGESTSDTELY